MKHTRLARQPHSRATTRRLKRTAVVCTVLSAAVATVAAGATAPAAPTAAANHLAVADVSVLLEWNSIAQTHTIPLRPTAHGQARGIAMVQGAVYDAVNAIDRGHQPYLLDVNSLNIDPAASYDAAIATAAHHVLVAIVAEAQVAGLNTSYAVTLSTIADGPGKAEGIAAGEAAAAAMLAARSNDGFLADFVFVIGDDPGDWQPTVLDPDPWVGELDPFLLESPSQLRSHGPNKLTSGLYAKEYNEVKEVGALNSTTRTPDQTNAAIFWQAPPTALYNRLFRDLTLSHDLDVVDGARLFAEVNLAGADGAIACWNDKYYWNFWRPVTAIHQGDTDGNHTTIADPDWVSLFHPSTGPALGTPPFPDHPSGHGCVSGAVLHSARTFFGKDKIEFDVHSGRFPGQPRHFESFSDALQEIVDARVWGGIHFRTADVQGAAMGKDVARWSDKHFFNPVKPGK